MPSPTLLTMPARVASSFLGTVGRCATIAFAGSVMTLAAFGPAWLVAILVVLAALPFAWGWPKLLNIPAQRGATIVIAPIGILSVLAAWRGGLAWLFVLLGLSVGIAFGQQMLRQDGRPRLTESVAVVVIGMFAVCLGSGWFLLAQVDSAGPWIAATGCALVVTAAFVAAPINVPTRLTIALGAGTLVAGLVGLGGGMTWQGFVLGFAVAAATVVLLLVLDPLPSLGHLAPALAASLVPVFAAGAVSVSTLATIALNG